MATKPLRTVEDFKGIRLRMGGEQVRVLQQFGAVPTMIEGSEVYEALSRGTLDAAAIPWTASIGAYKLHEICEYACKPYLGVLSFVVLANKDAWDALPGDFKKYHMEWYYKAPAVWAGEYKKADDKWEPIFKKRLKEIIEFPDSERNKLVAKAEKIYEKWADEREKEGLPGKDILGYYLKKRKELTGM